MRFFPASDSLQRTVDCETGCFHYQGTRKPFGLTIRPFVSLQTVINDGCRWSGASTRRLMAGLPIKSLFAGIDLIDLIELRR